MKKVYLIVLFAKITSGLAMCWIDARSNALSRGLAWLTEPPYNSRQLASSYI